MKNLNIQKKSRIRSRNKDKWWNVVCKRKRNSGEAYQYKVKGNKELIRKVDTKKVGPPCKCKKKCFEKLGAETINTIFKDFWDLQNYDLQTTDLQKKIEKEVIKRKRTKKDECHKSDTYKYFVFYDDKKYNVCKEAFLSIHAIGKVGPNLLMKKKLNQTL